MSGSAAAGPPTEPIRFDHTGADHIRGNGTDSDGSAGGRGHDDVRGDERPTERIPYMVPAAEPFSPPPGRHRLGELGPAETRGVTNMADEVVEKIAATALGEIDELGGSARRMLGMSMGSTDPEDRPRVDARVAGELVELDVAASVAYPAPVARVADRARAHVTARVAELTGMRVERVDITVTALTVPATREGRGLL